MVVAMVNAISCPFVNHENGHWIVTLPMVVQVATEPQQVPEATVQVVQVLMVEGRDPLTAET
jgi:hypothetical protein